MAVRHMFIFILLFVLAGCATTPAPIPEKAQPIFYPPAPDAPRLQFLTSFSSSDDLEQSPGAFKKFIVGSQDAASPIVKPYGVAVSDYKIYICDTVSNAIEILDLGRRKFEYFRPKEAFRLAEPINLSFDARGQMYVADTRLGQVVIFDKGGNYLGAIGRNSEFKPTGVLVKNDKIYICDLKTRSVRIFGARDRRFLYSVPKEGAEEQARLFSPTNIAVDEEGNLFVSDTGAFRVQKYSPDGDFLMSIGSHGDAPGQFARPKGVAVDDKGRLYVVDAAFENVQFFNKKGKLLLFFAGPGSSPVSLVLPAGIAIDYSLKEYFSRLVDPGFEVEYLVLVTSQYGDRKLSIFGFGHGK